MSSEHLCLKWNNFENNIANYLDVLRSENDFVDVTITCGGANFKAHKVILSACSPYFKGIFQENPCPHPVIILKNVSAQEMDAILRYIYTGQTFVTEENLISFLNTANLLQIIGLANYGLSNGTNGTVEPVRPSVLVKKFAKRRSDSETDEDTPKREEKERLFPPALNKDNNKDSIRPKTPTNKDDNCPILSTRLMLPKKRKVSVIDQNKNVQLVSEGSEGSNSSGEGGGILRGVLAEKAEPLPERIELGIKTEPIDEDRLLEPEVGLSVKDESDFESASEESLGAPNGDILLSRLQGTNQEESSEETGILRVPNPDVSIFSKTLAKTDCDSERLTLTPNVEIFLKNSSGGTENLLQKLSSINVFSNSGGNVKPIKLTKKPRIGPNPGTSKVEKDGTGTCEARTLHLTNLPCPHCRQVYNNLSALKYHVRLMHSDLENKLFCYLCPMSFIEREYFKIHLWESHNARF